MRCLCATLAMCLLGTGAMGQAFDCKMTSRGFNGFVGERMLFALDPENSEAYVYDGYIAHLHDDPLKVKVLKSSADAWKLKWHLEDFPIANGEATGLKYIATIRPLKLTVSIKAFLGGYDNYIRGSGTCSHYKEE